jgi:hypothetical protein
MVSTYFYLFRTRSRYIAVGVDALGVNLVRERATEALLPRTSENERETRRIQYTSHEIFHQSCLMPNDIQDLCGAAASHERAPAGAGRPNRSNALAVAAAYSGERIRACEWRLDGTQISKKDN